MCCTVVFCHVLTVLSRRLESCHSNLLPFSPHVTSNVQSNILCHALHRLYETFDEGTDFYIVTELVEGGELFDRIVSKAHYTEKEARDLIKSLLETLNYMHTTGVVHRDLKPENLLLCSESDDADIKIADFGFAKRISDLLPKETACGTPGYVAPEILRGDRYGAEVDIWR